MSKGPKSVLEGWDELGATEENLETMRGLALLGVKFEIIAKTVGISKKTLERMRKEDTRVTQALLRGSGYLAAEAYTALVTMARNKKTPAIVRAGIWEKLGMMALSRLESLGGANGANGVSGTHVIMFDDAEDIPDDSWTLGGDDDDDSDDSDDSGGEEEDQAEGGDNES